MGLQKKAFLVCMEGTGKSLSEALIFASTNPQYDDRLLIELRVQEMKIASSEHVVYIKCSECQNKNNLWTHVLSLQFSCTYWTRNSMNNLSPYCGLVDAIIATDKDLPVQYGALLIKLKLNQIGNNNFWLGNWFFDF